MIPFVKALGDEVERAAAARIAGRRGRIRRRLTIGGLGFAIAATGLAAASGFLTGSPEQLASTSVACYERADGTNAGVSVLSSRQGTPIEACRRALGIKGPLVACAGESVIVVPGRPGTCERLGFKPLPAEYATARERVLELEHELAVLEAAADCVPLDEFAARAQRGLDRLGWTGWRVEVREDLGKGPCGSALALNGDGSRSIEGTLTGEEPHLIVTPGPRRSTLDLLDGPGIRVTDATGERCYSVEGVEQLVRNRLPAGGRTLTFTLRSPPGYVDVTGGRGERLDEGCAVIAGMGPTDDDRGIEVEIWR